MRVFWRALGIGEVGAVGVRDLSVFGEELAGGVL